MAKAMLVIAVPAGIIEAIVTVSATAANTTTFGTTTLTTNGSTSTTSATTSLGGSAVDLVLGLFVAALSITTLFRIVGSAYLGQPVDWRTALRAGWRRMLSAVWISILIGLCVVIPSAIVVLGIVGVAVVGAHAIAALVGVIFGIGLIVYLVWFLVSAHLATPILMLEDVRGTAAIRRAIRLIRGSWWSVFGTVLLMALIVGVGSGVLDIVFLVVIVASHGDPVALAISEFFLRTIILVIFTPLSASLAVILTIDMRVRKEGFDIQFLAASRGAQ